MHESDQELRELQQLIDASIAKADEFLKQSFQMPAASLSARELVDRLTGSLTVSLATVTRQGEPRVAPINAMFVRGRYYIPTVLSAARTKMIQRNPMVSLTHYDGNTFAVVIHGQATLIAADHDTYTELQTLRQEHSLTDINQWGKGDEGVYLRIEPRVLYTFVER